jgi:thiol-disulfide isomerase/thioredoxin
MTRRVLISSISLMTCALLAPAAGAAPDIGKAAPRFALRDLEGALISLSDLAYSGAERSHRPKHVVVLDFFRTDCAPCRKGLPKLISLHKRFKGKKVKVILMALLEEDEGQEKLDRFLKSTRLPFPVLVDAYAVASKKYVAHRGGVSLPALFVIDRAGILRARYAGAIDTKAQTSLYKQISDLIK